MDQEEILSYFYGQVVFDHTPKGWARPFDPDAFRGVKLLEPIVDAETGEVVADADAKLTQRQARRIAEKTKEVLVGRTDLLGRFVAEDLVNDETGEIYAEAGEELTEPKLTALEEAGITKLPTLAVDQSNGPWIRNTLAVDKNSNRDDALIDIYRVMRPGEPPTPETAEALFRGLFFDPDRYDLSAVGRVKMNMRLGLDRRGRLRARAAQGGPAAHGEDPERAEGRPRADRRHRQPRQSPGAFGRRADGEPVPHRPAAHGAGDPRAHGLGRYRHRDAARPDQRQAGGGGGARILRLVAAFAVHGPDQPAVRGDAQAASVRARAGRSDPRARGLRGARRASDALRPHLPDRDAGRPEHRPDQLAGHLRQGQQVRLHRDAVHAGEGRRGAEGTALPLGDGGGEAGRRPGRRADGRRRQIHRGPGVGAQAGRLPSGAAGGRDRDRRVAEAAGVGGGGADPVPGERRRQPRADGLQHAASGGAADPGGCAAGRHRHGGGGGARQRRDDHRPPRRRGGPDRRRAHRGARDQRRRHDQGRRHLPAAQVHALQPVDLHQPASAGEGGRHGAGAARSSPTARRPSLASWRSAATCWSRSCRGMATTSRTRS